MAHIKSLVLPLLISICFAATILKAQDQIQLDCKELQESSGVAVSLNDPALIWSHNDSGGKPRLYLFSRTSGKLRGIFELKDVANTDWEDMCSFRVGNQNYLAIADTGDNARRRKEVEICIIKEPSASSNSVDRDDAEKIKKITILNVQYPGGAADCESIAFDPEHMRFILLTKELISCRLLAVPVEEKLFNDFEDRKAHINAIQLQGLSLSMVTGADICPQTRQLVICNYGIGFLLQPSSKHPLLWDRDSLKTIELPKRKQGEAIAFLNPRQVITTSESGPTPLWTSSLTELP